MRRHTRQMILSIATGVALAATAVVVFTPASFAAPGTVTTKVNVREQPSRSATIVGTILPGTPVDVRECRGGWCYVDQSGPNDGYVSAEYVTGGGGGGTITTPGFGFSIGPNGVQIGVGTGGNQGQGQRQGNGRPGGRPNYVEEDDTAEVCFYDRSRYKGDSFCAEEGESIRRLGDWADRISSIRNDDGLEVQVCRNNDFRNCRTYSDSASTLGSYDDEISSIRVR